MNAPQDPVQGSRTTPPRSGHSPSHSRSRLSISITSEVFTSTNEASDSHQPQTSTIEETSLSRSSCPPPSPPVRRLSALDHPNLSKSPGSGPPTPPPLFDPHGAAHPVVAGPDIPPTSFQPTTYRPTGPHLFDHLSTLPLDAFGRLAWFVLDKEEEIFELTDVLDEDKVICALWGRWILLNRPVKYINGAT